MKFKENSHILWENVTDDGEYAVEMSFNRDGSFDGFSYVKGS